MRCVQDENVGDVTARMSLREKCPHNFQWYLDTVFPELGLPEEQGLAYEGVSTNSCDP